MTGSVPASAKSGAPSSVSCLAIDLLRAAWATCASTAARLTCWWRATAYSTAALVSAVVLVAALLASLLFVLTSSSPEGGDSSYYADWSSR